MASGHSSKTSAVELPYNLIRNLTSPDEKANTVQTWFANIKAKDILILDTRDNLRAYIAEHSPSKRNFVHRQIQTTITELPDRFINRNSGIAITCTNCEVDDNRRIARLQNASIINGAQTQGEIRRYYSEFGEDEAADFMIRAEIIMEPKHEEIVEIAIARNTATAVKSVSQAGARGYLSDLKAAIEATLPNETIQMSETDIVGLNMQSVLQQTRLLMPQSLPGVDSAKRNLPYKQAGKCLADFSTWAQERNSTPDYEELYEFTVEMAPIAVREYRHWESHSAWNGHRLHEKGKTGDKPVGGRPVRRDKAGKVVWVAPGILFPIMSALSAFVTKEGGIWTLKKPSHTFDEAELIRRAVQQYRAMGRDVAMMGRNEAAYDALSIYTDTIASVLASRP